MNTQKEAIPDLTYLFIHNNKKVHYQKNVAELVETAITRREGSLTHTGALAADTGHFTGRTPQDRFIVRDSLTEETVWWGAINQPIAERSFDTLFKQMGDY